MADGKDKTRDQLVELGKKSQGAMSPEERRQLSEQATAAQSEFLRSGGTHGEAYDAYLEGMQLSGEQETTDPGTHRGLS